MRGNSAQFRRPRYRGSMVSRRMRGHTTPGRRLVEGKNGICGAARFERANLLEIFALKEERGSAGLIQS